MVGSLVLGLSYCSLEVKTSAVMLPCHFRILWTRRRTISLKKKLESRCERVSL